MLNRNSRYNRKLDSKRKQRVNRLLQLFDLLSKRDEIKQVWGWKAKRRTVNKLGRTMCQN